MKNRFLFLIVSLMFFLMVLSCCHMTENSDDPDNPYSDAFWLRKSKVFTPSDIVREDDISDVSDLYRDIIAEKPDDIILTCGEQVIALKENGSGEKQIVTYISDGDCWIPFFDGAVPIMPGIGGIASCEKAETNGSGTVVLKGGGRQTPFTLTCSAMPKENLIKFELAVELGKDYRLQKTDFGLTMSGAPEVSYAQAPVGIYGNMWGFDSVGIGMPSAYLWDKGREAVIFVDYSGMSWMRNGIYRVPENGYITAAVRGENTVFGLCYGTSNRGRAINGGIIPSGETVNVTFYLYEGFSARRSGLDCLEKKAQVMAPVHPLEAGYMPVLRRNLSGSATLSWESFADETARTVFEDRVMNTVTMNLRDPIITSDVRGSLHYVNYDRQPADSSERRTHQDFSCNYNWLSSLAAYNRIKGNNRIAEMVSSKMDSMQFYYDPEANMYRWGLRYNNQVDSVNMHLTSVEMPWQNLFFHQETFRSSMAVQDSDFSPAALSNLLSSLDALDELVRNSGYVLSQWVDPYNKISTTQRDVPALGIVYEPWQIGTYADILLKAYDITDNVSYRNEAANAITKVAEEVTYKVSNEVYTKTYSDSADFPITELFGSANGTYACYRLFEMSGEEKWLRYSETFFSMLVQMTTWYEDNLDEASRTMTNTGLFEPTAASAHACPWETIEALLPLTHILSATGDYAFNDLILAIFNCQRISSFNFFPATWSEYFRGSTAYNEAGFEFVPIETPYNNWHGGNSDYVAMYMASMSFWNYLLYEAYAGTDNEQVMTLFTDVQGESYEAAVRGAERNFILFNPTGEAITVLFSQHELPDGNYKVIINGDYYTTYSAEQLTSGISITVAPEGSIRIRVEAEDVKRLVKARQDTMTRYRLAVAYNAVTEKIQSLASEKFRLLYPDAGEKDIDALSNYVLTYMTYDDAMAHAADGVSITELKLAFSERRVVNGKLRKQYSERADLHIPDEYRVLTEQVDAAFTLFRAGEYIESYCLCDGIIKAVADGTEADFAATVQATGSSQSR